MIVLMGNTVINGVLYKMEGDAENFKESIIGDFAKKYGEKST